MRLPIVFYKSSILATFIGMMGSAMMLGGVVVMVEETFSEGLIPLGIGAFFCFIAYKIAKRAEFRKWIKKLKKAGALNDLSCSLETAVKLYNANPCKRTLKYIKSKNKDAAEHIILELKNRDNTKR